MCADPGCGIPDPGCGIPDPGTGFSEAKPRFIIMKLIDTLENNLAINQSRVPDPDPMCADPGLIIN
jgi:hypothetical protein